MLKMDTTTRTKNSNLFSKEDDTTCKMNDGSVSSNMNRTRTTTVSKELFQLCQQCEHHKTWHATNNNNNKETPKNRSSSSRIPEPCKLLSHQIRTFFLTTTTSAIRENSSFEETNSNDIVNLCSFYRSILNSGFCVHSFSTLFHDGKGAVQFLDKIHSLIQCYLQIRMISKEDNNNDNDDASTVTTAISRTIAQMIQTVPEAPIRLAFLKDWIELSVDLVSSLEQEQEDELLIHLMEDAMESSRTLGFDVPKQALTVTTYSKKTTQPLLTLCLAIVFQLFLHCPPPILDTHLSFDLLQCIDAILTKVPDTNHSNHASATAIPLLYYIITKGYISTAGLTTIQADFENDDTTTAIICNIIGTTMNNYFYQQKDNQSNNNDSLGSIYSNYLLPLIIHVFGFGTEPKTTNNMIQPRSSSLESINLFYKLLECIPYFMALTTTTKKDRLGPLICRFLQHLLVVTLPSFDRTICTHIECHGYYPILFELLLIDRYSNIILYGLLDPLWNRNDKNQLQYNPITVLAEDVCSHILRPQQRKRSKTNTSSSLRIAPEKYSSPRQQTIYSTQQIPPLSMVTPTSQQRHLPTKHLKRPAPEDTDLVTDTTNTSLKASLEAMLSSSIHFCYQIMSSTSLEDDETKTLYPSLLQETDCILQLCRALRIVMIVTRKNDTYDQSSGTTTSMWIVMELLWNLCAKCASALLWACTEEKPRYDTKVIEQILTNLIHVVFTAQYVGIVPTQTNQQQQQQQQQPSEIRSKVCSSIAWIIYVSIAIWNKTKMQFNQGGFQLQETISCEEISRKKQDNSCFCNKVCYCVSASFGVVRPNTIDCFCGIWQSTSNQFYKDSLGMLILHGCLPLQAKCFLLACSYPIPCETSTSSPDIQTLERKTKNGDTSRIISAVIRAASTGYINSSPATMCSCLAGLCLYVDNLLLFKEIKEDAIQEIITTIKNMLLDLLPTDFSSSLMCCLLSFSYIIESLVGHVEGREMGKKDSSFLITSVVEKLGFIAGFTPYRFLSCLQVDESQKNHRIFLFLRDSLQSVLSRWLSSSSSPHKHEASTVRLATYKFLAHTLAVMEIDDLRELFMQYDCNYFTYSATTTIDAITNLAENTLSNGSKEHSPSALAWIFLSPFLETDAAVRTFAAKCFGKLLQIKSSSLIYAMFLCNKARKSSSRQWSGSIESNEWGLWKNFYGDDRSKQKVAAPENMTRRRRQKLKEAAIYRLFAFIDQQMYVHCGMQTSEFLTISINAQTPFPNGTTPKKDRRAHSSSINSNITPPPKSSNPHSISYRENQRSAICALSSLCQYADVNTDDGAIIFQESLLRIVKLAQAQDSLRDVAFGEISRIHSIRPLHEVYSSSSLAKSFLSMLLLELIPFTSNETMHTFSSANTSLPYKELIIFIRSFLLPHQRSDMENVAEELVYLRSILPVVLPFFVVNEDYQSLLQFTLLRINFSKMFEKRSRRDSDLAVDLREETVKMCTERGIIEHILVSCLLHHSLSPFTFLRNTVFKHCSITLNTLMFRGDAVLKLLVWELGGANIVEGLHQENGAVIDSGICNEDYSVYESSEVLDALKKGALIRHQSDTQNKKETDLGDVETLTHMFENDKDSATRALVEWVNDSFMYLLVNVVALKQNASAVRPLQCLLSMLDYLKGKDSPQYLPQILSIVNTAMNLVYPYSSARLLAVKCLAKFVRVILANQIKTVGENLSIIIVSLFPVLNQTTDADKAKSEAVSLLESLVSGRVGNALAPFFQELPFLPSIAELETVRLRLRSLGVEYDALLVHSHAPSTCTQASSQTALNDMDPEDNLGEQVNNAALYKCLLILAKLMRHESTSVRKAVIDHAINVLRNNRQDFAYLVESEEAAGMTFLTVLKEDGVKGFEVRQAEQLNRGGVVSLLFQTMLNRFVLEQDAECRISLATLAGELGAVDPNRLHLSDSRNDSCVNSYDTQLIGGRLRLSQPFSKSEICQYGLQLITSHLVPALKSAPTTHDQHKIAFAIQESLEFLNSTANLDAQGTNTDVLASTAGNNKGSSNKGNMSAWLQDALNKSGVLEIVEPFWSTSYKQVDTAASRTPPFARTAVSYYQWISSFCRFMIERSHKNNRSPWEALFNACRSAIRSPAGLSVAEFLFPSLVVDLLCFGDPSDEIVIQEFADLLSLVANSRYLKTNPRGFDNKTKGSKAAKPLKLNNEDKQKAVNIVLTFRETVQAWAEREEEEHQLLTHRRPRDACGMGDSLLVSRSSEACVSRIFELLKQLPLDLCAAAAAAVGMHARSLRFVEMELRENVAMRVFNDSLDSFQTREADNISDFPGTIRTDSNGPGGALAPLQPVSLQLVQYLFGCLYDCDAMEAIVQESARMGLSQSVSDQINEREVHGDWKGALRGYEQALQIRSKCDKQNQNALFLPFGETRNIGDMEHGMLRSLLELGQLESVVNQVRGLRASEQSSICADAEKNHASNRLGLIPLATEAAWRLGRWELLDQLIRDASGTGEISVALETYNSDAQYQIALGKAMFGLHAKSEEAFRRSLQDAKFAVMESLSSSARDSYTRAFPSLLRLHCIREMEDASDLVFPQEGREIFSAPVENGSSKNVLGKWNWESRLLLSSTEISNVRAIVNTRVALWRVLNFSEDEGSLWLDLGRRERKQGLLHLSETSLAHAEAAFEKQIAFEDRAKGSNKLICFISNITRKNEVQMQLAKLKNASGDSSSALRMIEPVDISAGTLLKLDEKSLKESIKNFVIKQFGECSETIEGAQAEIFVKEGYKIFGWRLLQATEWMVGLKGGAEIIDRYRLLQRVSPHWEKAHLTFARYLDSLFEARQTVLTGKVSHQPSKFDDDTIRAKILRNDPACHKYLQEAISEYGKALRLCDKHLYQALPRLLQLWFEFTSIDPAALDSTVSASSFQEKQQIVNDLMLKLAKDIPQHQFYTVIPQLVSRIGHRDSTVQRTVKTILKRVLVKFPEQAMWGLAWLIHSKDPQRRSTGEEVFCGAQTKLQKVGNMKMHDLLVESRDLFKWLVELAKYQPKDQRAQEIHVRQWKGNVGLEEFVPPVQAALTLSSSVRARESNQLQADVFPALVPRMRSFSSKIKVMLSKARPKRLTAFAVPYDQSARDSSVTGRSSSNELQPGDLGEMHFLVKQEAKGDLRKDARVQDLNNVINRLFASSGDGRRQRRRLHLRTFSVVCLSEDTGILQWVPNTDSLRNCVSESYNPQADPRSLRRRGARIAKFQDMSLRDSYEKCQEMYFKHGNLTRATEMYKDQIIKAYPPVLYWWFTQRFQDPHAWFEARTRFALSAAVWSAVGSVIGLGDRHSENILLDTKNGECVHVDFDCIFDKGLNLPKPEVIPFRLTPNMIDAMGPTGWEGTYHGGLIDAMRTLRGNRDTLLSVLEPFLKDPVIDWKRQRTNQKEQISNSDAGSLEAKRSIKVIDERLRGVYNLRNPNSRKIRRTDNHQVDPEDEMSQLLPLSIEGQVHRMISEATSYENHVQLYVGWMPWV